MLLTLFAALLVFGCIGGGEAAPTATPSEAPSEAPSQEPTVAPSEPAGEAGEEGGLFDGLDYASILALGESGECTVSVQGEDYSGESQIWFSSQGKVRSETQIVQEGESFNMISISVDGKTYLNYPQIFEGTYGECDWVEFSEEDMQDDDYQQADVSSYSSPDYDELPETSFECHAAAVPSNKFETTGTVCTLDELIDEMTGEMDLPEGVDIPGYN